MKVVYVYADSPQEWNCSEWNCIIPTNAINRTKNHTATAIYINDFVGNTEQSQQVCNEADIIVVERNYFGDTLTMMQFWKVRGKTVIGIFDDAYDIMHPQNISYRFWNFGDVDLKDKDGKPAGKGKMNPPPLVQFVWGLKIVKAIQVPSVNLAKDWGKYNTTHFVHNFLDIDKYMNVEPLYPHPKDQIVIGWCGSLSHHSSFTDSGVLIGLQRVARHHKNVKILISGDMRVYNLLNIENKMFQPFVPKEQWCSLLKTLDIGLAPLAGEYDKRRSWIKAMEYMALKVPCLATNYVTYDELHDYITMTENGNDQWEEALENMITNYEEKRELANTKAYDFALSQSSDNNIESVTLALYEKLINEPYP